MNELNGLVLESDDECRGNVYERRALSFKNLIAECYFVGGKDGCASAREC